MTVVSIDLFCSQIVRFRTMEYIKACWEGIKLAFLWAGLYKVGGGGGGDRVKLYSSW